MVRGLPQESLVRPATDGARKGLPSHSINVSNKPYPQLQTTTAPRLRRSHSTNAGARAGPRPRLRGGGGEAGPARAGAAAPGRWERRRCGPSAPAVRLRLAIDAGRADRGGAGGGHGLAYTVRQSLIPLSGVCASCIHTYIVRTYAHKLSSSSTSLSPNFPSPPLPSPSSPSYTTPAPPPHSVPRLPSPFSSLYPSLPSPPAPLCPAPPVPFSSLHRIRWSREREGRRYLYNILYIESV